MNSTSVCTNDKLPEDLLRRSISTPLRCVSDDEDEDGGKPSDPWVKAVGGTGDIGAASASGVCDLSEEEDSSAQGDDQSRELQEETDSCLAFLGAGACLVGTGFMDAERRYVAVFLLAAAMAFMGLATAGVLVNTADFAPRYAGILFGISNTVATTPGMLAPLLAGILTPNKTQEEWRNVFYVCGGVCILGTLVFGTQARGELQPWAVEQATVEVGEGRDVPGGLTNDAVVNGRLEKNTTFMSTRL